jgi:hypothetical protein
MIKGKVLLFSLLLVFATSAFAGDVDDCYSQAGTSCALRVSVCPAGDFDFIWESCGGTGYIWAQIEDSGENPVPGIPWTDWWLEACSPDVEYALCICPAPFQADSLTNSAGRTTISGRLAMGGCILTGGLYLQCQGKTILLEDNPGDCTDPICLDIVIVGPDRNHNCEVEVGDLVYMGDTYNKVPADPGYDPCMDMNHDNQVDLSDFAFFGEHYNHLCF